MRVISGREVRSLLTMERCIDAMASALAALAAGQAGQPLRTLMWLPDRTGLLGMMPAQLASQAVMGIKVVSVMPGNHGTELDAHQGAVLLFETARGRPLALVDATTITAIRTAAVSGVATRLLARDDARTLGILGAGTQATTHLEAMLAVRPIQRVMVWSRAAARTYEFARRESARHGVTVEVASTAREAVAKADVICTTTSAREPVLIGEWLPAGTHINAVGSSTRVTRELDASAVARSRLFVDRRESALNESGDFLLARDEGMVGDDHIVAELGEVLLGEASGRETADEVTLFESLGLGVEDVAAARLVYDEAERQGVGTVVELGGGRT